MALSGSWRVLRDQWSIFMVIINLCFSRFSFSFEGNFRGDFGMYSVRIKLIDITWAMGSKWLTLLFRRHRQSEKSFDSGDVSYTNDTWRLAAKFKLRGTVQNLTSGNERRQHPILILTWLCSAIIWYTAYLDCCLWDKNENKNAGLVSLLQFFTCSLKFVGTLA